MYLAKTPPMVWFYDRQASMYNLVFLRKNTSKKVGYRTDEF
jgi:hypothetical protein